MRKNKSRKWQLLTASIMMSVCTSCFTVLPVWAAEYDEPLSGYVDDDLDIIGGDGNTVKLDKDTNTITYDFQGKDHTFTVKNKDAVSNSNKYSYVYNNVGGTLHIYQSNNLWNP